MGAIAPARAAIGFGLAMMALAGFSHAQTPSPAPKPVPPKPAPAKPQAAAQKPAPMPAVPLALRNFHNALRDLEGGRRQRVVVLQIGDSHTAADHFSGRLREMLQSRFGNAGRGHMPAGAPYDYYRPYQVRAQQNGNWVVWSSRRDDPGPFGVAGYRLRGDNPRDYVEVEATEGSFDSAEIDVLAQPGGGSMIVSVDGNVVGEYPTAGRAYHMVRITVPVKGPARILSVVPRGNGHIELLGWSLWRKQRGIALVNHGFPGAAVGIMERFDSDIVGYEMATLDPALVIVAFGTNEGFSTALDPAAYRQQFTERLAAWKRWAPHASFVVVGPPAALRMPDYCPADSLRRDRAGCAPVNAADAANYNQLLSQQSSKLCRWHEPPPEIRVREIQRAVSAEQGAFFWDWSRVPAGPCGMDGWAKRNPPLAGKDRVHMKPEGYALGAEALYKELMQSYKPR